MSLANFVYLTQEQTDKALADIASKGGLPDVETNAVLNSIKGYPALHDFKVVEIDHYDFYFSHILTDNTGSYLHTFCLQIPNGQFDFYLNIVRKMNDIDALGALLAISEEESDRHHPGYSDVEFLTINKSYDNKIHRAWLSNKFRLAFAQEIDSAPESDNITDRKNLNCSLSFVGYTYDEKHETRTAVMHLGLIKLPDGLN